MYVKFSLAFNPEVSISTCESWQSRYFLPSFHIQYMQLVSEQSFSNTVDMHQITQSLHDQWRENTNVNASRQIFSAQQVSD